MIQYELRADSVMVAHQPVELASKGIGGSSPSRPIYYRRSLIGKGAGLKTQSWGFDSPRRYRAL